MRIIIIIIIISSIVFSSEKNDKQINPIFTMGLSAVIPGSGQFLNGDWKKGLIFLSVELISFNQKNKYHSSAEKYIDLYENHANDYWSVDKWLRDFYLFKNPDYAIYKAFTHPGTDGPMVNGVQTGTYCDTSDPNNPIYCADDNYLDIWDYSHGPDFTYNNIFNFSYLNIYIMSDFRKPRPDIPIVPREALYRTQRPTYFKRPKGRRGRKPKGQKVGKFVSRQDPNFALRKKEDDQRKARELAVATAQRRQRLDVEELEDIRERRVDRREARQLALDRFALEAGRARQQGRFQGAQLQLIADVAGRIEDRAGRQAERQERNQERKKQTKSLTKYTI